MGDSEIEAQVQFMEKQTIKLKEKASSGELSKDDAGNMVAALFNVKKATRKTKKTT